MQKKHRWQNLLVLVCFLAASLCLLMRPINDLDEIWNYNFGYNMCGGLTPYADFNCIVTPLSFFVSGAILGVFGESLLVFRLLGAGLLTAVFYLLFLLLCACGKNRVLAFVGAAFAFALCYLVWIYNYNNLNLLLILAAMGMEFRIESAPEKKNAMFHIMAGLMYGLIFATKQSIGALMLVYNGVLCAYLWFVCPKDRQICLLRFAASVVPVLTLAVYLWSVGAVAAFWDYAVAGIGTFDHFMSYSAFLREDAACLVIGLLPLAITAVSIYTIKKGTSAISRRFHILSLIISWLGMSVAYPLCDYMHMCIAVVPFLVCGFCCIPSVTLKRFESVICILVALAVFVTAGVQDFNAARLCTVSKLRGYEGLPIDQSIENHIEAVDEYIVNQQEEGRQVLIADSMAAIYLLPLDIYYKDFSLLNGGNLGSQSVEKLLWRNVAIYLVGGSQILKSKQECTELIGYITTHYSKIGEVSGFDIYQAQ